MFTAAQSLPSGNRDNYSSHSVLHRPEALIGNTVRSCANCRPVPPGMHRMLVPSSPSLARLDTFHTDPSTTPIHYHVHLFNPMDSPVCFQPPVTFPGRSRNIQNAAPALDASQVCKNCNSHWYNSSRYMRTLSLFLHVRNTPIKKLLGL